MTYLVPDEWLGRILGKPAWRLDAEAAMRAEGSQDRIALLRGSASFVTARVPVTALDRSAWLERQGFGLIDTNLQFRADRPLPGSTGDISGEIGCIERVTPADRAEVVDLARVSFEFSRMHLDPRVGRDKADRSRAEWVDSFFDGRRGDAMFVAREDGQIAGFLLMARVGAEWVIDLIGVGPAWRRRSVATRLIMGADRALQGGEFLVGTQIANAPSIRLYAKLGFKFSEASYVFHLHGADAS